MASITIRNLDDNLKVRLRLRAAQHSCSMEAEVRNILYQTLMPPPEEKDFVSLIRKHLHGSFFTNFRRTGFMVFF